MTAIPRPTDIYGREEPPGRDDYLSHERGLASWLLTLDHKRIAILYMIAILGSFLLGGIFALLLRTELIAPGPTLGSDPSATWDFYNQMFTLHGAVMVFMFIIPAIPAILGNFALPLMLGAKDLAFPRINLLSWYFYMAGGVFFVWVLLSGVIETATGWNVPGGFGLDTGWTFYTPFSTDPSHASGAVVAATLGAFILGFSSILTGVNFIASIHMLRAPGQTWFRLPLFCWGLYATSIIQILATPVLAITLLLLAAERSLGVGIFDPSMGGDPILYQHFFWFYSHPAVYIMVLPAFGVVSELVSVFSRKHIFGYKFIAFSSIAIALLGFLVWGHHMFTSGQSAAVNAVFSLLTFSVAIPSAIKVFNWVATMYGGNIRLVTPMLYAIGFIMLFMIGGLTGLFLGSLQTDIHVHDTYFVVAHFHFVMVGSTLFAFLGGMHYWWPKMFGKSYSEWGGITGAVLIFIGFNLTFFPQFIAGTQGMPRRYADYPVQFTSYHVLSTIGAYLLGVGLFWVLGVWIHSWWKGKPVPANPWGGNSLEWHTSSPPPHENFARTPRGSDPYDFSDWHWDRELQTFVRSESEEREQEEAEHAAR
ncbi:MAG: cbb3-type cytochrome c oxidase subunit I [Phycisphaeraceae bacterium]